MYKALFFDFDGVLTENESGSVPTLEYLSKLTGRPVQELSAIFTPLEALSKKGDLPLEQLAAVIADKVGMPVTADNLREAFQRTKINSQMLQFVKRLHTKYKTGIITDNIPERFRLLTETFDLNSYFDCMVTSAQTGATKENPKIFEVALEKVGVSANEAVFIDNTPKNLNVPMELGFQIIHYNFGKDSAQSLQEKLAAIGLKV